MRIFLFLLLFNGQGVAVAGDLPGEVVDTDLSEHVEVRLVTIDVIALDKADRTVPGLGKGSFRLFVDGTETPIDTVDSYCGDMPEAEPRSLRLGGWTTPPDRSEQTRRVVLVFDYLHVSPTPVLEDFEALIKAKPEIHDEEIMVVALTGGLRVEQPFTRDRGAVLETLRRMEYDVTLWNGRFEHETEFGFFRGLDALMTLLRVTTGPKSIVLLTAGAGPGDFYDKEFALLATAASDAQARVYPVDTRGLISGSGFT